MRAHWLLETTTLGERSRIRCGTNSRRTMMLFIVTVCYCGDVTYKHKQGDRCLEHYPSVQMVSSAVPYQQ